MTRMDYLAVAYSIHMHQICHSVQIQPIRKNFFVFVFVFFKGRKQACTDMLS